MEQTPTEAEIDAAVALIVARPERHLGTACAHAAYEHLSALQDAGETPEAVTLCLFSFLAAKERLRGEVADLHLLG